MDCIRCLRLHGPGCAAAATVGGEDLCIWCIDGIPCARAQRLVKQLRSAAHDPLRFATANANDVLIAAAARKKSVTAPRRNGHDVTATSTPLIVLCKISGCRRKLEADDQGGLCRDHRRIRHNGAAVHARMLEVRAAAARQKPPANGHDPARSLGAAAAGSSIGKSNSHDVTTDREENSIMSSTSTPTTSAPPAPAARLCRHPKCTRELSAQNRSGYCVGHRDQHRDRRRISSNGHNGARDARAPAAKLNGSGKTNGHSPTSLIAERVRLMLDAVELPIEEVLQLIPIEDKQRFVENWLTGAA